MLKNNGWKIDNHCQEERWTMMVRCKSEPVDGVGAARPAVNKLRIVRFC